VRIDQKDPFHRENVKCDMSFPFEPFPFEQGEGLEKTLLFNSWRFMIQEGKYRILSFEIES